jgi:hypothetical protein
MLFKYLEETMPNLNHCIDCDKPMYPPNSKGLCDNCYHKVTRELGGEPTTADKYNKEWLDEQEKRTKTKTKTQQS